ncbi:hypothetical protein [Subtercola boreus]|uniref:hypothetical protein n=1 Tax=Subtercola boreus TaxID=120213 RepID=UPI000E37C06E|nr:hypothetical protein [Subtercola boreus]RFA22880.1 hypothetical protein B7R23_02550 [Subtercola boreus]
MSDSTQQALLGVLAEGGAIDAQRADRSPVSSTVSDRGTSFVEVKRYADGSINVFTLEKPAAGDNGGSPQAVQGCSVESTPQIYRRCTVNGQFTGVALAFFADYQLSDSSHAAILMYDSATVQCFYPLSCSTPVFEALRMQQNGSLPATLTLTTNYSGIGTGTTRLVLTVAGLSAQSN